MTELYLYQTETNGIRDDIFVTDKENKILARTNMSGKNATSIYDSDFALVKALGERAKKMYAPGERVFINSTRKHACMDFGIPFVIVSGREISPERYEQWKNEFLRKEESDHEAKKQIYKKQIYDNLRKIEARLQEIKRRFEKKAEERINQLPELPSLEQLLEP